MVLGDCHTLEFCHCGCFPLIMNRADLRLGRRPRTVSHLRDAVTLGRTAPGLSEVNAWHLAMNIRMLLDTGRLPGSWNVGALAPPSEGRARYEGSKPPSGLCLDASPQSGHPLSPHLTR